jgi:putative ABC transport system permease protein
MKSSELRRRDYQRYLHSLNIAVEAVIANRFRSMLTALGIIFGVAAVISMMAIGNGARKEILDQIKLVGVNNIVVTPILDKTGSSGGDANDENQGQKMKKKYSPGLTLEDAKSIKEVIPTVTKVSPEVSYDSYVLKGGKSSPAKLNGVTNDFFEVYNLKLSEGQYFQDDQMVAGSPVCIIGPSVKSKFFSQEDPIGKTIKCGGIWLTVIGTLENRMFNVDESKDIGVSDYNDHIYSPIQTVLLRYKDRAYINDALLNQREMSVVVFNGGMMMSESSSGGSKENVNQLDKIVVQVNDSKDLEVTTKALTTMLKRRHQKVDDFQISVPEMLLKQEQRTKDIFNIVLGVIAGISLVVGGIGIMNIMLASVMERTKEIGIRRASGATKKDVIFQFLSEATIISISGGVIGIALGVIFALMIQRTTGILTIVTPVSIVISFGVSAFIGILFGYMPAKRASDQDPVESLRYE